MMCEEQTCGARNPWFWKASMPRCGLGWYGMAWHSRVLGGGVSIERGNAMLIDLLTTFNQDSQIVTG
jgi:hypothetical protein